MRDEPRAFSDAKSERTRRPTPGRRAPGLCATKRRGAGEVSAWPTRCARHRERLAPQARSRRQRSNVREEGGSRRARDLRMLRAPAARRPFANRARRTTREAPHPRPVFAAPHPANERARQRERLARTVTRRRVLIRTSTSMPVAARSILERDPSERRASKAPLNGEPLCC